MLRFFFEGFWLTIFLFWKTEKKLIPIIVVDYRMCFTIWISFRFFWICFFLQKKMPFLAFQSIEIIWQDHIIFLDPIVLNENITFYFVSRHLLCFPIDFFHFILFSIEIQISGSGFLLPMVFFLDNFFLFFFTLIIGARFVRNSLRFVSLSWLLLLLIAVVVVVVTVAIISCCNHHKSRE